MRISKSQFYISVAQVNKIIKDGRQQIAFVGRSNVGKSSLLNYLCGQTLAKTSSTPGRTRLLNYFLINENIFFVDLPGYGYAKSSKEQKYSWQSLIEPYLLDNLDLKCVCVLIDSRIDVMDSDKQMINFLSFYNIPYIIIATKCDKLAKSKIKPTLLKLANSLGIGALNIYPCSSASQLGKNEILDKFEQFIK